MVVGLGNDQRAIGVGETRQSKPSTRCTPEARPDLSRLSPISLHLQPRSISGWPALLSQTRLVGSRAWCENAHPLRGWGALDGSQPLWGNGCRPCANKVVKLHGTLFDMISQDVWCQVTSGRLEHGDLYILLIDSESFPVFHNKLQLLCCRFQALATIHTAWSICYACKQIGLLSMDFQACTTATTKDKIMASRSTGNATSSTNSIHLAFVSSSAPRAPGRCYKTHSSQHI